MTYLNIKHHHNEKYNQAHHNNALMDIIAPLPSLPRSLPNHPPNLIQQHPTLPPQLPLPIPPPRPRLRHRAPMPLPLLHLTLPLPIPPLKLCPSLIRLFPLGIRLGLRLVKVPWLLRARGFGAGEARDAGGGGG